MGPSGDQYRVLQIHPTLRCNLRCLHCYSSSGPEQRAELGVKLLRGTISEGSEQGYTVLGVSGGEPLLYRSLPQLLDHARHCGMVTTVTSNGMLLDERRLAALTGSLDLLAISLDGMPASHNRMRGSPQAFAAMAARLEGVRRSGVPFAFIFTLTQHNLDELDWVAGFALDQGARLLQIHPLNPVGRARERLPAGRPDATAAAFAYLEAQRIQALAGDRLRVQLDLVHAGAIRRRPGRVFAGHCPEGETPCRLAEIVSPLVVEADGTVVPVQYGFARRYALGNLQEASLAELAMRWRRERYSSFQRLCRRIFDDLAAPPTLPFFNWYDTIQRQAEDERAL